MAIRDTRRKWWRDKRDHEAQQYLIYENLCLYFENIAAQIFTWNPKSLPPQLRSGWIERNLFTRGQLCAFAADWRKDTYNGFMVLPLARGGEINVYSELTTYNCISPNKTFKRDISNAVLIRNNELRLPTIELIDDLIWELADIRMAMRVNRNSSCKTPAVFHTSEKKQVSALNKYYEIVGNKPIIIEDLLGGVDDITYGMGDQRAPYYGDKLRTEYDNIFAEILTRMGIISNPVVKAERVNTLEAASNRGLIIDTIDSMLTYRQEACDQINDMFGDVLAAAGLEPWSCEINNNYVKDIMEQGITADGSAEAQTTQGGGDNGDA